MSGDRNEEGSLNGEKRLFETKAATLHLCLKGWSGASVDDWWLTF